RRAVPRPRARPPDARPGDDGLPPAAGARRTRRARRLPPRPPPDLRRADPDGPRRVAGGIAARADPGGTTRRRGRPQVEARGGVARRTATGLCRLPRANSAPLRAGHLLVPWRRGHALLARGGRAGRGVPARFGRG